MWASFHIWPYENSSTGMIHLGLFERAPARLGLRKSKPDAAGETAMSEAIGLPARR